MDEPVVGSPAWTAANGGDAASAALLWQRAITERLIVSSLRVQESAVAAEESNERASFLAAASRDLIASLDMNTTRAAVQRRTLTRPGSWCIVDVIEPDGAVHRLAGVHPDPEKRVLAARLECYWPKQDNAGPSALGDAASRVLSESSVGALVRSARNADNLAILRRLGFGSLLIVPLVARTVHLGSITFVTRPGNAPLLPGEIALATELAGRCALALDNARLHQESETMRAVAVAANNAKSDFMSNMSHELLTPLNAIGGYAEILEMGLRGPVTDEQRTDLLRIKLNQKHLLTMIGELLSYGSSDGRRLMYQYESLPVYLVLNEVKEMLEGAAAAKHLVVVCDDCDSNIAVLADATRLRQILVNLVMNAIKYASESGSTITLSCDQADNNVMFRVRDDGPGIAPASYQAIFEPFTQLIGGLTKRNGGVGLGLTISRELAREMHGDVTVESIVGLGTTFTVTLPRAPVNT